MSKFKKEVLVNYLHSDFSNVKLNFKPQCTAR